MSNGPPWSQGDVVVGLRLRREGQTWKTIGNIMGRSAGACEEKLQPYLSEPREDAPAHIRTQDAAFVRDGCAALRRSA